jgi:hypothetical protein
MVIAMVMMSILHVLEFSTVGSFQFPLLPFDFALITLFFLQSLLIVYSFFSPSLHFFLLPFFNYIVFTPFLNLPVSSS